MAICWGRTVLILFIKIKKASLRIDLLLKKMNDSTVFNGIFYIKK
jgi:hypothetical protein